MNNNKLIAEFMSGEHPLAEVTHEAHHNYRTSWDWLWPVLIKCKESVDYCSDNALKYHNIEDEMLSQLSIEDTYKAVVEFIKKHNDTVEDTNTMNSINITFVTKLTEDEFTSEMQRSIHHLEGVSWKVNWSKTIDKRAIVLKAIVNRYEGLTNLIPQLMEDADVAYVNIADDIDMLLNENQIEEIINELITTWDT